MNDTMPIDFEYSDFDIEVITPIVEDYDGFDIDFSVSIDLDY